MMQFKYDPYRVYRLMQEIEKVTGQCYSHVKVLELPKVGRTNRIYMCEGAFYVYKNGRWMMFGELCSTEIEHKGKRPKNAFQKRKNMRNSYGYRNQRDNPFVRT